MVFLTYMDKVFGLQTAMQAYQEQAVTSLGMVLHPAQIFSGTGNIVLDEDALPIAEEMMQTSDCRRKTLVDVASLPDLFYTRSTNPAIITVPAIINQASWVAVTDLVSLNSVAQNSHQILDKPASLPIDDRRRGLRGLTVAGTLIGVAFSMVFGKSGAPASAYELQNNANISVGVGSMRTRMRCGAVDNVFTGSRTGLEAAGMLGYCFNYLPRTLGGTFTIARQAVFTQMMARPLDGALDDVVDSPPGNCGLKEIVRFAYRYPQEFSPIPSGGRKSTFYALTAEKAPFSRAIAGGFVSSWIGRMDSLTKYPEEVAPGWKAEELVDLRLTLAVISGNDAVGQPFQGAAWDIRDADGNITINAPSAVVPYCAPSAIAPNDLTTGRWIRPNDAFGRLLACDWRVPHMLLDARKNYFAVPIAFNRALVLAFTGIAIPMYPRLISSAASIIYDTPNLTVSDVVSLGDEYLSNLKFAATPAQEEKERTSEAGKGETPAASLPDLGLGPGALPANAPDDE
jgi:hypothetical protein